MDKIWFKIGSFYSLGFFELIESVKISPLIPKLSIVSTPERDGSLNFTKSNEFNRPVYEDRMATISGIMRYNGTKEDKIDKINKMYNLIYQNQYGEFTTTESGTDIKWNASLENINEIEDTGRTTFRMILQYRLSPFSFGMPITALNQVISAPGSITIKNDGTAPTMKHTLRISEVSGEISGLIITSNTSDESLYINKPLEGSTYIEFESMEIKQRGALLINSEWGGNFFELKSGNNIINIEYQGGGSANFNWELTPMYLFAK